MPGAKRRQMVTGNAGDGIRRPNAKSNAENACKIEGLDAMAYHHLTENDANQAMKFSNF